MSAGIDLHFDAARYPLTLHEASVLHDLLDEMASPAAHELAALIRAEVTFRPQPRLTLNPNDIAVLRSALCNELLIRFPGLESIRTVLCAAA
jgi:hypothetical protein